MNYSVFHYAQLLIPLFIVYVNPILVLMNMFGFVFISMVRCNGTKGHTKKKKKVVKKMVVMYNCHVTSMALGMQCLSVCLCSTATPEEYAEDCTGKI